MTSAITRLAILSTLVVPACTVGDIADPAPLTYDQFVARYISSDTDADGTIRLTYDGDMAIESTDEIGQLYAAYVQSAASGEQISESLVRQINGRDDIWSATDRANLSYCIANSFGMRKAAVIAAMLSATNAWSSASNGAVRFVYAPAQDATCTKTNAAVKFNVVPIAVDSGLIARAFFPSRPRDQRELLINLPNAFAANPAFPLEGVLRHELGHALGLRHETNHEDLVDRFGPACLEDMFFREVIGPIEDIQSVMITPACMGLANAKKYNPNLTISFWDRAGIQSLYR